MHRMAAIPRPLAALMGIYLCASLLHFVHNAEFIAYYPGLPAWITREAVYWSWLVIASIGALGVLALRFGWQAVGALLIGIWGAKGLAGLLHYRLALCSEHTMVANFTIGFEVITGLLLMLSCAVWCSRALRGKGSEA
jgi:hypothetical protein